MKPVCGCTSQGFNFSAGRGRVPRMKRKREKEAETVRKLEKCKLSGLSGHSSRSKPKYSQTFEQGLINQLLSLQIL